MTRFILPILTLAAICQMATGQESSQLEKQALAVIAKMGGPVAAERPRNIALLDESDRQILIRYYQRRLDKANKLEIDSFEWQIELPLCKKLLLRLGDPQTLAETVDMVLRSDIDSPQYRNGCQDLEDAMRLETLVMIAPGMLVDEPFVIRPMLGDIGSVAPKSYGLASLMIDMVAKSTVFSPEVRKWAEDNRMVGTYKTKAMIQYWWRENEQAFKAKDYRAVRPGIDMRVADRAAKAEITRQQYAFKDNLIAKGKNPADQENWNEWREVILPRLIAAERNQTFTPPVPAAPSALQGQPQKAASPSNPIAMQSPESTSEQEARLWPLILGVTALAGLALYVWRCRQK